MGPNQNPNTSPPQVNPVIDERLSPTQTHNPTKADVIRPGLPLSVPTDDVVAKELNLSPGEELLCVINRHSIGIIQFYISAGLGIGALLVFLYFFIIHKSSMGLANVPDIAGILVVLVLAILLWGINTIAIRIYRMNRLVLTTESLMVERQQGLFNKNRKDLNLESIEDVSYSQRGILQPMFNYGTLSIATVGKDSISFAMASEPKQHADYINNAREQHIRNQRQS